MKRTRNSFSYKFHHWINIRGWEEVGSFIFEFSAGIAIFFALFLLPHFFH